MATFKQKLGISFGSALLFALVSLPITYKFTNKLFGTGVCPSSSALILHLLVFGVISYVTMGGSTPSGLKLKFTFYGCLMYYFVSSPTMFKFTRNIFGAATSDVRGCPTLNGVILHSLAYTGLLTGAMYLPDKR